jgi:DNA-binding transcriptional MocR family regulator
VAAKSTADLGSPLLTQKALQAYIQEQYDTYVYQLREELYSRLCAASEVLEQCATKEMQWRLPEGGLNLWLELQGNMDMHELHRQSLAAGVSFLPGSACYVAESDTTSLRICFTVTSSEALKQGLRILCTVIEKVSSKQSGATADRLPLI